MSHRIVGYLERPELDDRWEETVAPAWPEFLLHTAEINLRWSYLFEHAGGFQFYVVDEDTDEVLGVANTVPFAWDGDAETLPESIAGVLQRAKDERDAGVAPNTLCALQAIVTLGNRGRGLAGVILDAMRALGAEHGLGDLVAPVRPSWKARYPLQDFDRYVHWTREDGLPFDPWIRVHARAGGESVRTAPACQVVDGTVAEWESWTDMVFPDSGSYVIPEALAPLSIDVRADHGRVTEPNRWIRHRLGA
jgi:hypothetical protein